MVYSRERLLNWINDVNSKYSGYISRTLQLQLSEPPVSDDALKLYALMLYNDVWSNIRKESKQESKKTEYVYLVPHVSSDGSITVVNRYTGDVVAGMYQTASGLPAYYGEVQYMERLGGRNAYETFRKNYEDNDYVHDRFARKD